MRYTLHIRDKYGSEVAVSEPQYSPGIIQLYHGDDTLLTLTPAGARELAIALAFLADAAAKEEKSDV